MTYQRSALRHRVVPPSLRARGLPTNQRFMSKPSWSPIWIIASVLVLLFLVLGVVLQIR